MKKKITFISLLLVAVLMLAGCSAGAAKMNGTWECGSYSMTFTKGKYWSMAQSGHAYGNGTYKVTDFGSTLVLTNTQTREVVECTLNGDEFSWNGLGTFKKK